MTCLQDQMASARTLKDDHDLEYNALDVSWLFYSLLLTRWAVDSHIMSTYVIYRNPSAACHGRFFDKIFLY